MSVLKRVGSALNRLPSTDIIAPPGGGVTQYIGAHPGLVDITTYTERSINATLARSSNYVAPFTAAGGEVINKVACYCRNPSGAATRIVDFAIYEHNAGSPFAPTNLVWDGSSAAIPPSFDGLVELAVTGVTLAAGTNYCLAYKCSATTLADVLARDVFSQLGGGTSRDTIVAGAWNDPWTQDSAAGRTYLLWAEY